MSITQLEWATAGEIASAVGQREISAHRVVSATLARITLANPALNAFTTVVAERALDRAAALDAALAAGAPAPALAGVPFAVKNLFDIAGLPTRAGAALNADRAPATADASLISRLEAAGAILVGALNMGEYAYDFTGENAHDGPSRNPHDLARMSGGSSGGSASAVAGGLVPLSLASDTNGSIRVPSAFCGLFGLKPTYGRLGRGGSFPFVASFDHLGPIARTPNDLALAYDAMQGFDKLDHGQAARPIEQVRGSLEKGSDGLRIAVAGGYFRAGAAAVCLEAVQICAATLGVEREIELPEVARARASAYIITATEGAALHLDRLRRAADGFDPDTRDRLLAGTMLPAAYVVQAQKFRRWYAEAVLRLFAETDIILAPATPCPAPLIGQKMMDLEGVPTAVRPNLGIFTQPISFIGLPVALAPICLPGALPVGVQIIAAPWREDLVLRVAQQLAAAGVCVAGRPSYC
jgi:AtzE family amidohydrolase